MKMKDCIFCKIANGEIPAATLYEDQDFRVILDLGPASKGHALILPKAHFENLYELPDDLAGKALILAKEVTKKMKKVLNCDGYNAVSYTHLDVYKRQVWKSLRFFLLENEQKYGTRRLRSIRLN